MNGQGTTALGHLRAWLVAHAYWLLPATALVVILAEFVDRSLALFFKAEDPRGIAFFVALNDAGNSKYYLVPAAIAALLCFVVAAGLALDRRRRVLRWIGAANLFLFASVAISGLTVDVMKLIFARARPRLLFANDEYGWHFFSGGSDLNSFPSGHANTMVAVALALGYLMPRARWAFLTIALPIAFARVANTNHFLSDVIAGAAVALATAPLVHAWFVSREWVFEKTPQGSRVKAEGRLALARLARPFRPFGRLWA